MSNRKNYRRGEERRTEHGPRYEGDGDPGAGCNSTHVARARRAWRNRHRRSERRRFNSAADLEGQAPVLAWIYKPLNAKRKGQGLSLHEDEDE